MKRNKPSRQVLWQKKMHEEGRCVLCGDKALGSFWCLNHVIKRREYERKRKGWKRRYVRAASYKAEVNRAV